MNICFVIPSSEFAKSAGSRIRIGRFAEVAPLYGAAITVRPIGELLDDLQPTADAYIFVKTYNADSLLLADRLKKMGCIVGADLFDDYFSQTNDVRLARYRRWLADLVPLLDFALSSTVHLKNVLSEYRPDLLTLVLPDPSPHYNPLKLSAILQRKIGGLAKSRRLQVLWFGIGDNPYFDVGLHDVRAHCLELEPLLRAGMDVDFRILTNMRAVKADGLALIRRLPIVPTIEEWTEEREEEELNRAHVCFLPVSAQSFSRAKSLNRAVTALLAGCQVVSVGYPLYRPFENFLYRSFSELLSDIERGSLRHRPEQVNAFSSVVGKHANPYSAVKTLNARLSKLVTRRLPAAADRLTSQLSEHMSPAEVLSTMKTGFRPDRAIVHGTRSSIRIHKFAQKVGALSIKSPFTTIQGNFDVRFEWAETPSGVNVLVSKRVVSYVDPSFQNDFDSSVKILDREYLILNPASSIWGEIGYMGVCGSDQFARTIRYRSVLDAVLAACRRFFPRIGCFVNEEMLALP